jgi:hypothetical protein
MKTRLLAVPCIAIAVLYLTIWPHEVGHSLVAYLYGCKPDWWRTDMSWFLWNSWGGAIDENCLHSRGGAALGLTEFGGIIVNLLLMAGAALIGRQWHYDRQSTWPKSSWLFIASFFWALANYAEAFSYLVLNTAWLKSDMLTVVQESGVNHWIWFAGGCLLGAAVAYLLRKPALQAASILAETSGGKRRWLIIFVLYVAVVGGVMGAARASLKNPHTTPKNENKIADSIRP